LLVSDHPAEALVASVPHILEVATPGRRIRFERGRIFVSESSTDLGSVPVSDLTAVLLATPAVMISGQALSALAQQNVLVVLSGPNFAPAACVLPIDGHHAQGERIEAQVLISQPQRKRAWADIVRRKIKAQAAVLEVRGVNASRLHVLAKSVRSGDLGNSEALAAQAYWPALMGAKFRRDRDEPGANAMLNYGYAVLRAATARAIVSAGLHPSISLHHKSRGDALRLADDLMEPFRPAVDLQVVRCWEDGATSVSPEVKRSLAGVLRTDFSTDVGTSPLSSVLVRLATSFAEYALKRRDRLNWPISLLPVPQVDAEDPD
jgi:CRISPR-associated protein Cas1